MMLEFILIHCIFGGVELIHNLYMIVIGSMMGEDKSYNTRAFTIN